jgi:MFS family permease
VPIRSRIVLERKWWTLVVVCIAIFMLLLDITIVNVALPPISRSLHAGFTDLQWVIDAYALGLATCVLNAGSLADLLGRKRVFVAWVALFTATSAPVRRRDDAALLNPRASRTRNWWRDHVRRFARAFVAGVSRTRARDGAFGIWGATTGAAVAIGPLVCGALTTWLSWR